MQWRSHRAPRKAFGGAAWIAAAAMLWSGGAVLSGCGSGSGENFPSLDTRLVTGQSQSVAGGEVTSWARLARDNTVVQVGVTVPLALAQNLPEEPGSGPSGAIAVLEFPEEVKSSTFFNHFELQSVPHGHPPAIYGAPHFDFHFYNIPAEAVRQITAPDPVAPAPERLPAGYVYPGPEATVPEMGVHASPAADFAPGAPPFTATMIAGFYNGRMHFLEPMITAEKLLQRQSFLLDVPRPAALGQNTRYPTKFVVIFDAQANAYHLVFTDFVSMTQ